MHDNETPSNPPRPGDATQAPTSTPPRANYCAGCRRLIGYEIESGGATLLALQCGDAALLLVTARGVCACGCEFNWRASDVTMERLMARRNGAHGAKGNGGLSC